MHHQLLRKYADPVQFLPHEICAQAMALRNRILKTFEDTIEAGPDELQSLLNFVIEVEARPEWSSPAPWPK